MPMQLSRSLAAAAVAVVVVGGTIAAVTVPEGSPSVGTSTPRLAPSAWRGLVGTPRTAVSLGQRVIVLLAAPSLADRVRLAGGSATDVQERRWTSAVLAGQEQFLAKIAAKGVIARPDLRFTRVVNGFSAIADPRAVALLERSPTSRACSRSGLRTPPRSAETAAPGARCRRGLPGTEGAASRSRCSTRPSIPPRRSSTAACCRASTSSTAEQLRATTSVPAAIASRRTEPRRRASSRGSARPVARRGWRPR